MQDLNWKLMLIQAINFAVLMAILWFLLNKFIRPFMHKRAEDIRQAFADIETQKKDIEAIKQEYANQLNDLKAQARETIDKAVNEGNQVREEILAQADKDRVELLEKAKKEIEHEARKAIVEIQKEVAALSIMAAGKIIKKQVDEQVSRTLVEDFLRDLDGQPGGKRQ